jgi:hypothetical protein
MNIILISNRLAKTRTVTLNGWQIMLLLLMLSGVMLGAALTLQYMLVRFAPAGLSDDLRALLSEVQSDEQLKQQGYLHSSLDAMALRVGQMQARVQRLDALGARLAKLTGMKPEEFQFAQPPAQGGPLVVFPAQKMSENSLDQQLNGLSHVVSDRSDKLMALETMLLQNQLSSKMLPSIPRILAGVLIHSPAPMRCTKEWTLWRMPERRFMRRPVVWWHTQACIPSMVIWWKLITVMILSRVMGMLPSCS